MSEIKESTPDVPAALDISSIAVIGGTGGMGSALAWCWGRAGYKIFIGSRNAEKAELAAEKLNTTLGLNIASGLSNQEAASVVEIIVLTVPFANHEAIVDEIAEAAQGKIVVDTTVPLVPPESQSSTTSGRWFSGKKDARKAWKKCARGFRFSNYCSGRIGKRQKIGRRGFSLRK